VQIAGMRAGRSGYAIDMAGCLSASCYSSPKTALVAGPIEITLQFLHVRKKLDVQQIFCLTSTAADFSIRSPGLTAAGSGA
jgi:hypothetical protein